MVIFIFGRNESNKRQNLLFVLALIANEMLLKQRLIT